MQTGLSVEHEPQMWTRGWGPGDAVCTDWTLKAQPTAPTGPLINGTSSKLKPLALLKTLLRR